MCPVIARSNVPTRGASSIPCSRSSEAMSASVSQIGISMATVTLSLASMKFCNVSWRSLLLPTAGMINSAAAVAAFCFLLTMMRETSANSG